VSNAKLRPVLAAAVQALTQAAIQGEPAPRAATARIDDILRAAYDLDTATYDRLRIVAEWDQTALVSVDPLPVSDVDAPHILRGVVEAVEPAQGRITLWIDEFAALQHVPIAPAMPGWPLFDAPSGIVGCHPSAQPAHGIAFSCDDIHATIAELQGRGVRFLAPVQEEPWGWTTEFDVPGAGAVQLYQPKYSHP